MIIPFDILYEGFCNRVRSSGNSDTILSLVKKGSNDRLRIKSLLEAEPELQPLLERNINESYEKKDELVAQKLWERGLEGKSLELLTEAIAHVPIPVDYEEKVVRAFEEVNKVKSLVQRFTECEMKENVDSPSKSGDNSGLMAKIMYDRACMLFSQKRYVPSFKEFIRAWQLGMGKSLELSFQISVCFCELGQVEMSKELLQCSAQHLRTLPMSNEDKSAWTMNIVRVLKVGEARKKLQSSQSGKNNGNSVNKELSFYSQFVDCEWSSENDSMKDLGFLSLFSGESQTIKGGSDALELKYSQEKGRHMVAKRNIEPGSTIIVEDPYAWTVNKPNYHKFCTWCLHRIESGIPCTSCASASFCNNFCRQKAMTSFHEKECQILKLLDSSQKLGNMALLCYRTILKAPQSSISEFTQILSQEIPGSSAEQESSSSLSSNQLLMGVNEDKVLDSSTYLSVFSQTSNSEQRQAADLLKRTISAIYLTLCLKFTGYFGETVENPSEMSDMELDIAALLLRHLQSASCNAYGINCIEKKKFSSEEDNERHQLKIDEIGGATYPIISTTNHTCNPNAYRINVPGRTCVVKSLRIIREGEEIFDCYGPLYLTEPRQERMSKLQNQYLFRCGCTPCVEDWPLYGKLRGLPVQFKCSSCHCALKIPDGKKVPVKITCPYCDKVTDLKTLRERLAAQKEKFNLAKSSILSEHFQPFDKGIEGIICEYVQICQEAYLEPCIENVEAQEVLKLFWNLSIRNT